MCPVCHAYDHVLQPKMRVWLKHVHSAMKHKHASYWSGFAAADDMISKTFQLHDQPSFWRSLELYLASGPARRGNIDTVFDLGEKDQSNYCRRFAKDLDDFQLHWKLRDVIKEELRRDLETPEPKTLYMWADWKVIEFNCITKESQSPGGNISDIQ